MTRKPIIAGNWKMNQDHLEASHLIQKLNWELQDASFDYKTSDVLVIPPFTDLRSAQTLISADNMEILLGAQDISEHESGAYTGEISGQMLQKLDVSYVLVGHSERREYHRENSKELLGQKIHQVLANGMTPIFCVGEPLDIRESGQHVEYVLAQVAEVLELFEAKEIEKIVVAYEPVWAIGTGKTATAADAEEMCKAIRGEVAEIFGNAFAANIRLQYGGSAKSGNAMEIMSGENVDGLLVGGASLDAEEFAKIVRISAKAKEA